MYVCRDELELIAMGSKHDQLLEIGSLIKSTITRGMGIMLGKVTLVLVRGGVVRRKMGWRDPSPMRGRTIRTQPLKAPTVSFKETTPRIISLGLCTMPLSLYLAVAIYKK